MAAYAQFGYGYPSANQLIGGVSQSTATISTVSAAGNINSHSNVVDGSVPSPHSGTTNETSLSPSCGSSTTGLTAGQMSPGAISQASNNAGSIAASASASATTPMVSIAGDATVAVGSCASVEPKNSLGNRAILPTGNTDETHCCENGKPIVTDPISGQTVCSCQYDTARLTLSNYTRMPATGVSVYGGPYPSTEQNPYPSIGVDSSAFYSPLSNPYGMKENAACSDMSAWTTAGLQPTTGYYSYDPTLAAYGYGPSYDLAARRKNATRESTATLKAWLNEHKKNPYPTKGEKIMLAIITKMTLTQVSTWFANARRRLKKENKMTWEPKNKTEDDDDGPISDDEKEKEHVSAHKATSIYGGSGANTADKKALSNQLVKLEDENARVGLTNDTERESERLLSVHGSYNASYVGYNPYQQPAHHQAASYYHTAAYGGAVGGAQHESNEFAVQKNPMSRDCGIPVPASKPKIWSLADTVACKTPPPTTYPGQNITQLTTTTAAAVAAQQQQQQQSHTQQLIQAAQFSPVQQQQQQQQHQIIPNNMIRQAAHVSPLNMMSNYGGASPYSRIPTVYTEAMQLTHCDIKLATQQQQQQQIQAQRVGFPEIQPDTPPQTPPNIKTMHHHHNNSSSNSHSSNSSSATAQAAISPTIPTAVNMCYNEHASSYMPAATLNHIGHHHLHHHHHQQLQQQQL